MRTAITALLQGLFVLALMQDSAYAADEYAVHVFKCPPSVNVKFNWQNKIQANPEFGLAGGADGRVANFKGSAVQMGINSISCVYSIDKEGAMAGGYIYKVKRKIINCTGQPGPEVKCNLKD